MVEKGLIVHRLKKIEGQVRGLQKMIESEKYCVDIIIQSTAVKKALSAVENLVLENHLAIHVTKQMKLGEAKKAIQEILKIYDSAKRK